MPHLEVKFQDLGREGVDVGLDKALGFDLNEPESLAVGRLGNVTNYRAN